MEINIRKKIVSNKVMYVCTLIGGVKRNKQSLIHCLPESFKLLFCQWLNISLPSSIVIQHSI